MDTSEPKPAEAALALTVLAARALGVGTAADLADYFRLPREDARQAIAAANAAFPAWGARTGFERGALLHRVADVIERRSDELARILTLDQGTTGSTALVVQRRLGGHHSARRRRSCWMPPVLGPVRSPATLTHAGE